MPIGSFRSFVSLPRLPVSSSSWWPDLRPVHAWRQCGSDAELIHLAESSSTSRARVPLRRVARAEMALTLAGRVVEFGASGPQSPLPCRTGADHRGRRN